jgi:hypothetical protein
MVVTLLRSANALRVSQWAEEFGSTHPILDDVGQLGDVGIEFTGTGQVPYSVLLGPGGVVLHQSGRVTDEQINSALETVQPTGR